MKKYTNYILGVLIALIFILLFQCKEATKQLKEQEQKQDNIKDAISFYENSMHSVDLNRVKELYQNYKSRIVPHIQKIQTNQETGVERKQYLPTEFTFIPLQELKNYIKFIEALQHINPKQNISGIAINLGAYNIEDDFNTLNSDPMHPERKGDYRGRITSFLTPTFYDKNNNNTSMPLLNHVPFYIEYQDASNKFKGEYKPIVNYNKQNHVLNSKTSSLNHKIAKANALPLWFVSSNSSSLNSNQQSVSMDEFTNMPPKSAGGYD